MYYITCNAMISSDCTSHMSRSILITPMLFEYHTTNYGRTMVCIPSRLDDWAGYNDDMLMA